MSWNNTTTKGAIQTAINNSTKSGLFGYITHAPNNGTNGGGNDPYGTIDSVSDTGSGSISVRGWAYDADNLSQALEIHVYIGGQAGSGAPGYSITANTSRPDVNNVYGCGDNHGFDATITTDRRGTQEVYIYAINIGGGSNVLLGHKSVNITAETTPPTISDVTISQMTSSGFRVSCKVSDASGISKVQFPTWTDNNGQDDLIWHDGTISNGTATAYIKTSDHNGEGGTYIVHIYAYDTCGNSASTATATVITDTPTEVASTTYNGNTYKVFNSGYNWQQAKEWCEENGGHLAAITSSAEWSAVKKALETFNGEECWLGAENTSGSWAWVTGESFSYSNWASGQPDNGGGTEHYLGTINSSGGGHLYCYSWNDYNVSSEYVGGFVCEYESVKSVTLSSTSVSMLAGDTEQLTATVTPSSYSGDVTWTSSDTKVATVDSSGKITAVGVGSAKITASVNGKTATCAVTVKEKSSITLSASKLTIGVGESQQLTATVTPSEYADDIEWSSDADGMEVDVDEDGTITVNSYTDQVVNITAELPDGTKAVCKVTVDSDGKDYETVYLEVGKWYYIGDWDSDFVDPEDIGTFESSDTSVATVNEYGVIEGVSNGTAIVTYTDLDGNSSSFAVTVVDALSDSIDVAVGGEHFMDIGSDVTLESSDTSVAIVGDCFVIGVSAGTATITATAESGATSSCTVYVSELEGIHFGAADNESVNLGDSYRLDYLYTDPYDDYYVGNVTWTSSDESIATVDADGIVTAVSLGTATITATTDEGFSAACTVTVNAIRGGVESIEVTKLPSKEFTEELDKNWFVTDEDGYVYIDYDAAGLDSYEEMEEFDNKLICYNMAGAELKVTFKDGTEETFTVEENASLKGSPNLGYYYFDIDGETLTVAVSDIGGYEAMITCYDYITTFSVKPDTGNDDNTVIKGDVNDDGKVNVRDASRILQYICGWNVTVNVRVIDVNGDGKVNVRDASRLLQYICGWKVDIYIDTLK